MPPQGLSNIDELDEKTRALLDKLVCVEDRRWYVDRQKRLQQERGLDSSVKEIGKVTTQIFHSVTGKKRTFTGLLTDTIKEGSHLKIKRKNGGMLIINPDVNWITEVFGEDYQQKRYNLRKQFLSKFGMGSSFWKYKVLCTCDDGAFCEHRADVILNWIMEVFNEE